MKSIEREVDLRDGVWVGDKVRVCDDLLAMYRRVGISDEGIARCATVSTVKRIVVNDTHGWASAELSSGQWFAPADLVRVDPA